MKVVVALIMVLIFSEITSAQVYPGGTPVVKASNGAVVGKVFDIDEGNMFTLNASYAIVTLNVNGENGIAAVFRDNLAIRTYYETSSCTGTPYITPAYLTGSTTDLQFSDTTLFLTDAGGQALYRADPTGPLVNNTTSYYWDSQNQTCTAFAWNTDYLEGELVNQNFGTQFPAPYRLAVNPDPPASAMTVPVLGRWGLIAMAVFLGWQGIRQIRGYYRDAL